MAPQLYDFYARQYAPQLGRFWGIDPADQFPSGYTGMGNDPANGIDPDGMQVTGAGASGPAVTSWETVSRISFEAAMTEMFGNSGWFKSMFLPGGDY